MCRSRAEIRSLTREGARERKNGKLWVLGLRFRNSSTQTLWWWLHSRVTAGGNRG